MNIPEEAVEAAAEFMKGAFDGREQYGTDWKYLAEEMLPLVAPFIAAHASSTRYEFGAFRRGDTEQQTPLENFTFRWRWLAEKWLKANFSQPETWEIRQRRVGEWEAC